MPPTGKNHPRCPPLPPPHTPHRQKDHPPHTPPPLPHTGQKTPPTHTPTTAPHRQKPPPPPTPLTNCHTPPTGQKTTTAPPHPPTGKNQARLGKQTDNKLDLTTTSTTAPHPPHRPKDTPHTHPHHQLPPQAKRPHTHHSPTTPTGQDQARLGKQTDSGQTGELGAASWRTTNGRDLTTTSTTTTPHTPHSLTAPTGQKTPLHPHHCPTQAKTKQD